MIVYIIFHLDVLTKFINSIESVWETRELANAAVYYHASHSNQPCTSYYIAEREINTTTLR
jgi:hypothetical protein